MNKSYVKQTTFARQAQESDVWEATEMSTDRKDPIDHMDIKAEVAINQRPSINAIEEPSIEQMISKSGQSKKQSIRIKGSMDDQSINLTEEEAIEDMKKA